MTAVQEIQPAIEKLTTLRDETNYSEMNGWLAESVPGAPGQIDDPGYAPLTNDPLIVTLHNTIDAQLAILQGGVTFTRQHPHLHVIEILDLARSINGVSS